MGRRPPVRTGDEQDVVGAGRRVHHYLDRPGATDKIKRGIRRRERRAGKAEARREAQ